jgi:hypothetical protein
MKPQVKLDLPGMEGMLHHNAGWEVDQMDWSLPGGAQSASLSAGVLNPALINQKVIRSWLGKEVSIYNETGQAIWRGWIEEIALDVRRLRFSWSTQKLLSRVIARYPQVSTLLDPLRSSQFSEWVQHAERLETLGAKEAMISLQQVDANSAQQAALYHLLQKGQDDTNGLILRAQERNPRLEIRAKGWWQRLDWTLDGEDSGLLAHLPGGKSQQLLGLSGSERLAQSFKTGSDVFTLGHIWLRGAILGNPADDLRVKICTDNAGVPGSVLASSNLPNANLQGGWGWKVWLLDATLNLAANTRFWLVVERTGALDSSHYFALETDDGRGYPDGDCKRWNGSSWVLLNQDLRFCLVAVSESTELMRSVAERAVQGGVLQGVQIWQESGKWLPRWRELDLTRMKALESWLEMGCADERELSAFVNAERVLEVFSIPRLQEIPVQLRVDGSLRMTSGVSLPLPLDLLGRCIYLPQMEVDEQVILRGLRWTKEQGLMPVV